MIGWLRRRLERIAMDAAREIEDQVALDLELGMSWRRTLELVRRDEALTLTLGATSYTATASLFRPDAAGHAVRVHFEPAQTPTAALDAMGAWLRGRR